MTIRGRLRVSWLRLLSAFGCRHQRLDVFHYAGIAICRDCSQLWRAKNRGTVGDIWASCRLTDAELIAAVQNTAKGEP